MPLENIVVQGAREHNLKDVSVTIPRNKLVVMTGVSGSGKSSLAFDTIYAEGQRRYVESLSSYARQFLGRMDKPDVDYIEGLSPAISIDQKGVSHNPRSTVGTVTEIYDYLRLLFARTGHPHCYKCGRPVERQTVQQIVDAVLGLPEKSRIQIMAPMVRRRKGEHKEVFEDARKAGFVRVRVNGEVSELTETFDLDKQKWHDIEVVVDRLVIGASAEQTRVADSVETALKMASGVVLVDVVGGEELLLGAVRVRALQYQHGGDGAAHVQLQQPAWCMLDVHGAGVQAGGGPGPGDPEQEREHRGGGGAAVGAVGCDEPVVLQPAGVAGGGVRLLAGRAGAGDGQGGPGQGAVRDEAQGDQRAAPHAAGEDVPLADGVRGCDQQPAAAVQRYGVGACAVGDRAVHVVEPVQRVRG